MTWQQPENIQDSVLKPFIKDIWMSECFDVKPELHSFKCFADGLPGLMFYQGENPAYICGKKLSTCFFYGQTVKPIEISVSGSFRFIVVYLYPHVMKSLIGLNSKELTDTCVDINLIDWKNNNLLTQRLLNTASVSEQIDLLKEYLLGLILANASDPDYIVRKAVSRISRMNGAVSLRDIWSEMKLSERTFERKFEQHVGISANLFSRICRFQASLVQLRSSDFEKLSDIAYENGFADQSHYTRFFKEFTGLSPREYYRIDNTRKISPPELRPGDFV